MKRWRTGNGNRFEVYWVDLNPTVGAEMQKIRPCVTSDEVTALQDVLRKMCNTSHSYWHLSMGACFHGNFFCYIPDGLVIHASSRWDRYLGMTAAMTESVPTAKSERGKNKKVVPKFGGNKIITYLCSSTDLNRLN